MPNKVEVITLTSSDEDSNPQVENTRNIAKQQKSTARKSLHSTTTIRNTTIKDEPTATKVKLASVDNSQFSSATSSGHQQQNAPKTLPKYDSQVHKVVSTPTTSPNPATITSQSRTVTVSTKQSVLNPVTNTASKMPGITITPLDLSSKNKVVPTSQTNCDPKGIGKVNLNKHFRPSSTSTPKISNGQNSVNANTIKTLSESNKHINAKAPIISSVYSLGVSPSKAINEAQSSSSTGKFAKNLPALSISPSAKLYNSEIPKTLLASLGKTGVTITKNSVNRKIPESLNTSMHKQNEKRNLSDDGMAKEKPSNSLPVFPLGVTVEKITVNKQILESTKEKVSNKFVLTDKTGITVAKTAGTVLETPTTSTEKYKQKSNVVASATTKEKFLNSFVPVNNRLFQESKTATNSITDKNILSKQATKEFSGISNMAAKSGTTMTAVGQVNKQTKPQIYTKSVHTRVIPTNIPTTNRKLVVNHKQEIIFGSQFASTEVKDNNSKLSNDELSRELITFLPERNVKPKEDLPKSSSDSIAPKKSNKAVTIQPVSKVATSSRSVNSQNNKGAPKKRTLTESDSRNDGTSKKAKLDLNSRLNGAHSNLATAEENMKRISALKESLKVIAEGLTKSTTAGKNSKESSNSGTKGLVDNNKTEELVKDLGSKSSKLFNESLPNKDINAEGAKSEQNKNSMKKDQNEKPLKQTSPNTIKKKFQNFYSNIIRLAGGEASVKGLYLEKFIQKLIDGTCEPEEFSAELKNESTRPQFINFLKASLPHVRQALLSGEMTIKGIRPPPLPASVQSTAPAKQVTSPKLSLKRKHVINSASASRNISSTPIPLQYFPFEPLAKKAKLDSKGTSNVPIAMGWKNEENPKESSVEPNQGQKEVSKNSENVNAPPQNSVSSHITSQNDTSGNVDLWDKSEDNATKFNKLLEFSKSFMTATPTEKCTIVKNFHRLLKKADPSYVDSSEFSSLLESTLQKIKDSKDTFIQLQKVKAELKAYKRSKNATTPSRHRLLSSSSEQSEAVASNLEIPSDESPKKVPAPNLADEVASAMLPNFIQKETSQSVENNAADAFINVPCSSKQADIIESLHFSMPVSNGVKLHGEFRTKVLDTQRTSVDKPSVSEPIPTTENILPDNTDKQSTSVDKPSISIRVTNAFSGSKFDEMADPVPLLPASDPEIEVVNEVVIAAQKKSLIKGLNLQSIDQRNVSLVKIKSIQGELQVNNLPPIPVKESEDQPKISPETTDLDDMAPRLHDPSNKVSTIIDQSKSETNILPPMSVPEVDQPETSNETTHPAMKNLNESKQEVRSLPSTSVQKGGDQPESLMKKIDERVKYLETLLGKLDKKIKKLQAKELSMDDLDDQDSTYILEDRYKIKFQKTWAALCNVKKRSTLVGREIEKRFQYQGCRHSDFNKAIEKLVNKRKPAEKFPNYVEVHNMLKKVNERAHLSLSSHEIERAAKEAFEDIGKELKRRRQADEDRDFGCYLTDDISLETDPAEQDEELKRKLTSSVLEGERKIAEIIEKYAAQEGPNAETGEGSNCEEEDVDDEMDIDMAPAIKIEKVESVQHVDSVAEGSLEDPVGIEVTAKSFENTDLPDTDPATPETDECEDNTTPIPISVSRPATDVIDIDSSSSASTDPGPNATERSSSNFVMYRGARVIIPDMRDFNDEPPTNYDDSSPELPPLSELLKM